MPRRTALVVAVLGALVLSGCSGGAGTSAGQGYVSGDGTVTVLPVSQRHAPGQVAGRTLSGGHVSLADLRGRVVVVNVWGSWCSECRIEAPALTAAARSLQRKGVAFVGIDSRDPSAAAARAYVRRFAVPYPSIYDPDGTTLLAFQGTLQPNSIPSTVILDRQGRVAASVLGTTDRTTLEDLVHEVATGSTKGAA